MGGWIKEFFDGLIVVFVKIIRSGMQNRKD